MTRCDDFHDAMAADAAGEIDPATQAALAIHLDGCRACARDHERLRAAFADLGAEPVPDPGPLYWTSFGSRLRDRIAASRVGARRRAALLAAAGLAAACGLALVLALRSRGLPADAAGGASVSRVATGRPAEPGSGEATAEARFEAALDTMRSDGRARPDSDLEAILDDIAPGDPFALAGGLDEIAAETDAGSGV